MRANVEEAGTDYSDDHGSDGEIDRDLFDDWGDDLDEGPQRKTFYQSHIFPMHMLQSLKVGHIFVTMFDTLLVRGAGRPAPTSRRRAAPVGGCAPGQSSSVATGNKDPIIITNKDPASKNDFLNHPCSSGSCSATSDCSDKNEDGCLCSLNVLCE